MVAMMDEWKVALLAALLVVLKVEQKVASLVVSKEQRKAGPREDHLVDHSVGL